MTAHALPDSALVLPPAMTKDRPTRWHQTGARANAKPAAAAGQPIFLRIGAIDLEIRSDLADAVDDLTRLYRGWKCAEPTNGRTIRMDVRALGRTVWGTRRYSIIGDGKELYRQLRPEEVLPYLEWGINYRVIATRTEYLQLHAATLAAGDRAILLVGQSGCGKSTLSAALATRGWRYLSDEFALVDPDTLDVHAFPKALCIKAGAFDIVRRLGLPLWQRRPYVKAFKGRVAYASPHDLAAQTTPSPVRLIVFMRYNPGPTTLRPVSRGAAAFALAANAFNRDVFGGGLVSILGRFVGAARCVSLDSGGVEEAVPLIQSLLSRSP